MVIAPIKAGAEESLRRLLATMNKRPGVVDPHNALVPFALFDRLHVARFVVFSDVTLGDVAAHGVAVPQLPTYLVFLGDCDGPAREQLADMAQRARHGLQQIFSFCDGFQPSTDLLGWLLANDRPVAAAYVNWIGRTVKQIREEDALHRALVARAVHRVGDPSAQANDDPQSIRQDLIQFVRAETDAGRLVLTPPQRTPLGWQIRNLLHAILWPLLLLAVLPVAVLLSPLFLYQLRRLERTDPEFVMRPDPAAVARLHELEDHDVTNQFSAIGSVKPGLFRRWTLTFVFGGLDYASRHVYKRGYLTRVQTIHFARWAFFDDKRRVVFASNYDGILESYMDDFINKVAWGLNLAFSNGVGYPRTAWLLAKGARNEQAFKNYLRRHEVPSDVWYKAYPGLTAVDLARNSRIRRGLERVAMSDAEVRDWLNLL